MDSDISGPLYKIRTNGKGRQQIAIEEDGRFAYVNVVGDWIYYQNGMIAFTEDSIYKVRTNGKDRKKISDDAAIYLNVVDDWI